MIKFITIIVGMLTFQLASASAFHPRNYRDLYKTSVRVYDKAMRSGGS